MGELVAAFGVSHAPGITAWPQAAPPEQLERILAAFGRLRDRLTAARPDLVVLVAAEHWANFFLDNMPVLGAVGLAAEYEGPVEDWLKLERRTVPGAPEFARALLDDAVDAGIEPSASRELVLDHASMLPIHLLIEDQSMPIVPIILNCLVEPMARPRRCYELGQSLRRTIARRPERVAVIGSGGLSHWPGEPEHGRINTAWDEQLLETIASGRGSTLAQWTDADIAPAGSGAHEIRTWLVMLGAAGDVPASIELYQPCVPFATGCAAVALAV